MPKTERKPIRRKVTAAEPSYGRVPEWFIELDCGHHTEVIGWGSGAGIPCPKTTI